MTKLRTLMPLKDPVIPWQLSRQSIANLPVALFWRWVLMNNALSCHMLVDFLPDLKTEHSLSVLKPESFHVLVQF